MVKRIRRIFSVINSHYLNGFNKVVINILCMIQNKKLLHMLEKKKEAHCYISLKTFEDRKIFKYPTSQMKKRRANNMFCQVGKAVQLSDIERKSVNERDGHFTARGQRPAYCR